MGAEGAQKMPLDVEAAIASHTKRHCNENKERLALLGRFARLTEHENDGFASFADFTVVRPAFQHVLLQ